MDEKTRSHIRRLLHTDPIWSAYALADLDPAEDVRSTWHTNLDAVLLRYRGLNPPVLFAHGTPDATIPLLEQIPPAQYQFSLQRDLRSAIDARLRPSADQCMWRMVLDRQVEPTRSNRAMRQLHREDLPAITDLFGEHPDRPDSFHPEQMEDAPFYGYFERETLVSIAGVHIMSRWAQVAAIGNVFTHPDRRGHGLASIVCGAVVCALLEENIEIIVLNVATDNEPAIRCYQRLGFRSHCTYQEGFGEILP
jgi:RimJ/RimL family protein N-acetyltransferase